MRFDLSAITVKRREALAVRDAMEADTFDSDLQTEIQMLNSTIPGITLSFTSEIGFEATGCNSIFGQIIYHFDFTNIE